MLKRSEQFIERKAEVCFLDFEKLEKQKSKITNLLKSPWVSDKMTQQSKSFENPLLDKYKASRSDIVKMYVAKNTNDNFKKLRKTNAVHAIDERLNKQILNTSSRMQEQTAIMTGTVYKKIRDHETGSRLKNNSFVERSDIGDLKSEKIQISELRDEQIYDSFVNGSLKKFDSEFQKCTNRRGSNYTEFGSDRKLHQSIKKSSRNK